LKKIQLSLQSIPDQILLGECHGDLTFSNIIVERPGKICIFDFLNPPFETPYEDAAKFLQDAQFFWSIMKHKGNFDKTRVMIYWSYAESILRSELEKICDFNTLRKFQILGLLRIIPYTFDDKILQSLRKLVTNEVENDLSSSLRR